MQNVARFLQRKINLARSCKINFCFQFGLTKMEISDNTVDRAVFAFFDFKFRNRADTDDAIKFFPNLLKWSEPRPPPPLSWLTHLIFGTFHVYKV